MFSRWGRKVDAEKGGKKKDLENPRGGNFDNKIRIFVQHKVRRLQNNDIENGSGSYSHPGGHGNFVHR